MNKKIIELSGNYMNKKIIELSGNLGNIESCIF